MSAQLAMVESGVLRQVGEMLVFRAKIDGAQFDCGYLSPYFVTHPERMEAVLEDAYILIYEASISLKEDILPLLDQITKLGRPLLIVAGDVLGAALAALVVNNLRGELRVAAVRASGSRAQQKKVFEDIAVLTGARIVVEGSSVELKDICVADLGQAKQVTVGKNSTAIKVKVKGDQLCFQPQPYSQPKADRLLLPSPALKECAL